MGKLYYFVAASVFAKKELPPLSGDAKAAWADTKGPSESMESMYRDEMVGYGKNDWNVFADGVIRWVGKMEKDFKGKIAKCGANYWENPMTSESGADWRKRREIDQSVRGERSKRSEKATESGPIQMNEWCDRFNGHVNGLVAWTETYMVECCYMVDKSKKCIKAGDKYVKKWKKIMSKFTQGARNQEAGARCSEDWEPTF